MCFFFSLSGRENKIGDELLNLNEEMNLGETYSCCVRCTAIVLE